MSTLQIPSQYVLKRLPQDDDELYWAIRALWGYSIPRTAVCKGHTSPFQALADAYFARHPISIWKASRGLGGKSRTLAVLGLTEAALHGCEVSILGGSGAQSLNVHAATSSAWHWHAAPKALLSSPPTKFDTVMSNGGHLRTLMASQNSVRGPHPPRLRMDEIDEMDLPILEAALGQPMRQPNYMGDIVETQTVMSSTHQYPDKTMSAMLKRAKQSGWPVYHWCIAAGAMVVTGRGEIPIETVTTEDKVLTHEGWRTVQHVTFKGYKQTVKVTTSDGRVLRCTPDHRILTEAGWQEAGSLQLREPDVGYLQEMQAVCESGNRQAGSAAHSRSLRTQRRQVRTLRKATATSTVQVLPDMLDHHRTAIKERAERRGSRTTTVNQQSRLEQESDIQSRTQGGSTVRSSGIGVRPARSIQPVASGFRDRQDRGGSLRLLAHDPGSDGTGQAAGSVYSGSGVRLHRALGGSSPLVVVGVEAGPTLPVWDIGVDGTHSFVAEGVVVHNCFRETSNATDGWLTADEIARQKSVIPEHMWRTEFELQEPAFEGRAIDTDAVDRAFDPSYGTFTGDKPVLSDPMEGSHYITAADWAKERDMSIVGTFDISQTPWVCVAWQKMNRLPWPIMVGKAIAQWQTFGGKFVHDATGVGSAVADIIKDQAAPHLHRDIIDFVMTAGRQRQALFTEYVSAIEQGDIKYPRIEYAYDEHRYVVVDDLYGRGHPPDSIIVGALAWSARRKRSILAIPTGGTRGASPWNI